MMRNILIGICIICTCTDTLAHIGSPGVTFEGKAGPYSVLVLVSPPDVIPGTATVDVYATATDIQGMGAKPVYWYAGDEGTPNADDMLPVAGEPGHYRGTVWLMAGGTSGIEVEIRGSAGGGKILVPVMAVSTAQRDMPASLGWTLALLAVLLLGLMVTIIGASVSDGLVEPGGNLVAVRKRRWTGVAVSALLLGAIVWGGNNWWSDWALRYKRFMYQPMQATSRTFSEGGQTMLSLTIDPMVLQRRANYTRRLSFVVPDHGKLMHLFLVRAGTMDVFAHLHPQRKDSATYLSPLPPLPPGQYLLFADISRLSGFSETIADTLVIDTFTPASTSTAFLHRDDTYFVTNPLDETVPAPLTDTMVLCGKPGVRVKLPGGATAIWEQPDNKPLVTGKLYELAFAMRDKNGEPLRLQPYLGMMGHAVVMKTDGSVYIHLHPVGNYSVASQQAMLQRFEKESGPVDWNKLAKPAVFMDSVDRWVQSLDAMTEEARDSVLMGNMPHGTDSAHVAHGTVTFPYAFPSPGRYRIWLQTKYNNKILNTAFDAVVN